MTPKFKNTLAWEQAQLLMQPAFIRVIDNIRKELEQLTSWQSNYEEVTEPYPGYLLCLSQGEHSVKVNLWDLCFQICFLEYPPTNSHSGEVEVDTSLINDSGDVDWLVLENKTQGIVKQVFNSLPHV